MNSIDRIVKKVQQASLGTVAAAAHSKTLTTTTTALAAAAALQKKICLGGESHQMRAQAAGLAAKKSHKTIKSKKSVESVACNDNGHKTSFWCGRPAALAQTRCCQPPPPTPPTPPPALRQGQTASSTTRSRFATCPGSKSNQARQQQPGSSACSKEEADADDDSGDNRKEGGGGGVMAKPRKPVVSVATHYKEGYRFIDLSQKMRIAGAVSCPI
ncbi:hypothetical protein DFJ73DRAFT_922835 [Zopfochytrium polystomum]|nr:hypothetical protein DFJ73DRAFT_922835 [Zopfochytrium polystomum]